MSTTIPSSIRTLRATPTEGKPSKFEVVTIPFGTREDIKNLAPTDIISKTVAIALNPTDTSSLGTPATLDNSHPVVPGCDNCGTVVAVGSDVTHVKVGDRVASFVFGNVSETEGAFAEYVRSPALSTWPLPKGMSDLEGAAFTLAHLTVVQAFYSTHTLQLKGTPSKPITEEKTILISGGSTAVGHHAVQVAALSGYKVLVTSSPASHALLKSLGASETFDYHDEDVAEQIKAASNGGVDYAYDTSAKENTIAFCIDSIKSTGGPVFTTLPISDANKTRRADVPVEFSLLYRAFGKPFEFYGTHNPARPQDSDLVFSWIKTELPALLEGWKEGEGSSRPYRPQKLRIEEGGLVGIEAGLNVLKNGTYKAEKLVYLI